MSFIRIKNRRINSAFSHSLGPEQTVSSPEYLLHRSRSARQECGATQKTEGLS
jgi:hypothetical protein